MVALRQSEVQARKDRILAITVEEYIKTVAPVSSSFIVRTYPVDLSSATIRNILAELEAEGYLTHPHTSAGRVPTHLGYRYYVDHLMNEIKLLEDEQDKIKQSYLLQHGELEELLDKTSFEISNRTQYTSIISVDGWGNKFICRGTNYVVDYSDYQDVEKIANILRALDEKERILKIINQNIVRRVKVLIGHEIAMKSIEHCSLVISPYKAKNGLSGRIAVLGPTRMNYERVVSTLDYFSQLMEEII